MKTKIHYLYRDASNYKVWGEHVVEGELTRDDFTFYDEIFFIPAEMGIPDLRNELVRQGYDLNDDDHDWHELIELEACCEAALELPTSLKLLNDVSEGKGDR